MKKKNIYAKVIKRILDFFFSFLAIIILSPLLTILIIIGTIAMGGNPFFTQERPGRHEYIFKLIKFRTMSNEKDKQGILLPDEKRINKYGRLLRSTSLDELPELFNIFIGNMSIVGPRPLLVSYLPYYTEQERHRHDVRPGLTGLAQVKGRSFLTWEEIFYFDIEYVEGCSFCLDTLIFIQTIKNVLKRKEIADVQQIIVDQDGNKWVLDNGIKRRLHRPLNEERT